MAVKSSMFLFEVVVEKVEYLIASRNLIIRASFADIFSLELKDPKQMSIIMPEPPPLPPEPPGKKGKKAKPKPKPKKGKKGAAPPEPPPEPAIQAGQSILFTSSAEILAEVMNKCPLEVSLWCREKEFVFIGSTLIAWDPKFFEYLAAIYNCRTGIPITVKDDYNVFEEGTAKIMAKISLQVKLTHLTDKIVTTFRTLSEDPIIRKVLYTGMNSTTTSVMCNFKSVEENDDEETEDAPKVHSNYIVERKIKPIVYADYKNAPGAKLTITDENENCCYRRADKPPDDIYTAPETCPDIDSICDYVRKIITSCNTNMRMLTPHPTIRPRVKATDIDRLCYCGETNWPMGDLADRFKKECQTTPCPVCSIKLKETKSMTFDIANLRGPCGRNDCRVARDIRAFIRTLYEEDQEEININEIVGPCGSKSCTIAERVQDFLRRKGPFKDGSRKEGLLTQCGCLDQMQQVLTRGSCETICTKSCDASDTDSECDGPGCPFRRTATRNFEYNVYFVLIEYDKDLSDRLGGQKSSKFSFPPQSKSVVRSECPDLAKRVEPVHFKAVFDKFLNLLHCPPYPVQLDKDFSSRAGQMEPKAINSESSCCSATAKTNTPSDSEI